MRVEGCRGILNLSSSRVASRNMFILIFIYTGAFFLVTHLFVVLYEEPTLRRTFGDEYEAYFGRVSRWLPRPSKK